MFIDGKSVLRDIKELRVVVGCSETWAVSRQSRDTCLLLCRHGGYNGYKPLGIREIKPGVFDNTEIFNIPKFIPALERPQPEIINEHREEIEVFARHIDHEIVRKLLTLYALVLELPEDYFLKHHRYEAKSDW